MTMKGHHREDTGRILELLHRAEFKRLDDGSCFGEVPGLAGVWANERTLRECRMVLRGVLDGWVCLKLRDRDPIPSYAHAP